MNCWRRIADIARATPSISALTKLSVTGSPRKRAALARLGDAPCARRHRAEQQRGRHRRGAALAQPGRARGAEFGHAHPIEMIDSAPSRRPMMLRRFDSAASSAAAARASPRNLTPPGPQVPLPVSCSGPSVVVTDSSVALLLPLPPVSVTLVAAERVERRQARRDALEGEVDACRRGASGPRPTRSSRPGERRRKLPPSWSVFQGVPRPPSQALGHWPIQSVRGTSVARMRPRPGRIWISVVPLRQHSWRAASSAPYQRGASVHSSRPGSELASRLPGPPVRTATALPDQTVPRASARRSAAVGRRGDRARQPRGRREQHQPGEDADDAAGDGPAHRRAARLDPGLLGEGRLAPAGRGDRRRPELAIALLADHGVARQGDRDRAAVAGSALEQLRFDRPRARRAARFAEPVAQGLERRRP